jgi:phosphonate transport system ATP-binding protein
MRFGKLIFDGVPADLDQEAMDAVYSGTPGEERQQADAGPAQTRAVTS